MPDRWGSPLPGEDVPQSRTGLPESPWSVYSLVCCFDEKEFRNIDLVTYLLHLNHEMRSCEVTKASENSHNNSQNAFVVKRRFMFNAVCEVSVNLSFNNNQRKTISIPGSLRIVSLQNYLRFLSEGVANVVIVFVLKSLMLMLGISNLQFISNKESLLFSA